MKNYLSFIITFFLFLSCSTTEETTPIAPTIPNRPPEAFTVTATLVETEGNVVNLTWTTSKDPDGDVINYDIEIEGKIVVSNLTTNSYTLNNLAFDKTIIGKIIAKDTKGLQSNIGFSIETKDVNSIAVVMADKLYAFDAQTGVKKWEFKIETKDIFCAPTIANGLVYAGANEKVVAVDIQTGVLKWEFSTVGLFFSSSPMIYNGVLYIGGRDSKVYALNADTGVKKWELQTESPMVSSPNIANGIVYIGGTNDKKLYAIDAETGKKKWEFLTGSMIYCSPAIADGVVYFGSGDAKLYALDASTGVKKWESKLLGSLHRPSPTVSNSLIYVGSWYYGLNALNISNGTIKWGMNIGSGGSGVSSSPIVAKNTVYIGGGNDKKVYALDAENGAKKWEFSVGSDVIASPTYSNNFIFIGIDKLYALDAVTGVKKWEALSNNTISGFSPVCVLTKASKVYHSGVSGAQN